MLLAQDEAVPLRSGQEEAVLLWALCKEAVPWPAKYKKAVPLRSGQEEAALLPA